MPSEQQRREPRSRSDQPFRAHARFGQTQVQRVIAARGQLRVDVDQIAHAAHLGREDDHVVAQAVALRSRGRIERARNHGLDHHFARGQRLGLLAVLVHHARQKRLIERAPVDADAHRLPILDGALDHDSKIVVVLPADRNIAGIDAILGERARRGGKLLEQDVAVVVEVADDGHAQAALFQAFDDLRARRLPLPRCSP